MSDDNIYDFGFSLMTETEIKQEELKLKKIVEKESYKLDKVREMITPFLTNLMKDPEKEYIYWPERKEKVELFLKQINDFIDSH
tara:strand:- start:5029 stop:5280 length:252 start_codon:yes stop_codon:yes gene_type:complete